MEHKTILVVFLATFHFLQLATVFQNVGYFSNINS